jgi:hypothetical protein
LTPSNTIAVHWQCFTLSGGTKGFFETTMLFFERLATAAMAGLVPAIHAAQNCFHIWWIDLYRRAWKMRLILDLNLDWRTSMRK